MTSDAGLSPGLAAARQLADTLAAGQWPPYIAVPIRLDQGEGCMAQAPVSLMQFTETDAEWVHKTGGGLSLLGAAVAATNVVRNHARKAAALRAAAPQWRPAGSGLLYITNQRLLIQEQQEWFSIWYPNVITSSLQNERITIEQHGGLAPLALSMPNVEYYWVLYYMLCFRQLIRL